MPASAAPGSKSGAALVTTAGLRPMRAAVTAPKATAPPRVWPSGVMSLETWPIARKSGAAMTEFWPLEVRLHDYLAAVAVAGAEGVDSR